MFEYKFWINIKLLPNYTSSIELIRSRHIPLRRYRLQVAIRGISATVVPCTLQRSKRLKNNAIKQRCYFDGIKINMTIT